MDSINKNQQEDNIENLHGQAAGQKIKELTEKADICFFCTGIKTGMQFPTRPMAVQEVDDMGNIWFLSADDSHKNAEIAADNFVQLLFQGTSYSDFLTVYGKATISKDKQKIKQLWKPILKTWFTEGEDDARITVIKVETDDGYYWDLKHGMAVSLVKRVVGAITGKTMDDSIEGTINL